MGSCFVPRERKLVVGIHCVRGDESGKGYGWGHWRRSQAVARECERRGHWVVWLSEGIERVLAVMPPRPAPFVDVIFRDRGPWKSDRRYEYCPVLAYDCPDSPRGVRQLGYMDFRWWIIPETAHDGVDGQHRMHLFKLGEASRPTLHWGVDYLTRVKWGLPVRFCPASGTFHGKLDELWWRWRYPRWWLRRVLRYGVEKLIVDELEALVWTSENS